MSAALSQRDCPSQRQPARLLASSSSATANDITLKSMAMAEAAVSMRAWRGRSGKRYVVSVYPLDAVDADYDGAVLMAVAREPDGSRRLMETRASPRLGLTGCNGRWLAAMRERGANELHIHLLAANAAAQLSAIDDLAG
jgi:hypothetical protein